MGVGEGAAIGVAAKVVLSKKANPKKARTNFSMHSAHVMAKCTSPKIIASRKVTQGCRSWRGSRQLAWIALFTCRCAGQLFCFPHTSGLEPSFNIPPYTLAATSCCNSYKSTAQTNTLYKNTSSLLTNTLKFYVLGQRCKLNRIENHSPIRGLTCSKPRETRSLFFCMA